MFYKLKALFLFHKYFGLFQLIQFIYQKLIKKELLIIYSKELGGEVFIRGSSSDFSVLIQMIEEMNNFNLEIDPDLIIDGGANIGLSVRYFREKYKNSMIQAYEPDLENYRCAQKNCQMLEKITLVNQGLWSSRCHLILKNPEALPWAYQFEKSEIKTKESIEAISLNDIFLDIQLGTPILVKLDVEGAEKELILNENQWLQKVKWVLVEIHGPVDLFDQEMKKNGFSIKRYGEKQLYTKL